MGEVIDLEVGRFALRTFRYSRDNHAIYPMRSFSGVPRPALDVCWTDGTCEAQCLRFRLDMLGIWHLESKCNEPPGDNCECGIYGSLSLDDLKRMYGWYVDQLVCVFAPEGKTIIGSRGLRTERARVVAYCTHYLCHDSFARLFPDAKRYFDVSQMVYDHGLRITSPDRNLDMMSNSSRFWTS